MVEVMKDRDLWLFYFEPLLQQPSQDMSGFRKKSLTYKKFNALVLYITYQKNGSVAKTLLSARPQLH